jgi:hypothetical protein
MTDASITSPANTDVLSYDSSISKWKNAPVPVGPSPSVRASSTNSGSSGTSASVTVPATAVVGDVLLMFVGSNYAANSGPSGWTALSVTSGGWHNAAVYSKICASGDIGATVSATLAGSEFWDAHCLVVKDTDGIVNVAATQTIASQDTLATLGVQGWTQRDTIFMFGSARKANSSVTFPSPAVNVTSRPATESLGSAVYRSAPPGVPVTPTTTATYTATSVGTGTASGFGVAVLRAVALGTQGTPASITSINDTTGSSTTPSFKVWTNVASTTDPVIWSDSSGTSNRTSLRASVGISASQSALEAGVYSGGTFYKRFAVSGGGAITRLNDVDFTVAASNANPQDMIAAGVYGQTTTFDRGMTFLKRNNTGSYWPAWNFHPYGYFGQPLTQTSNYTFEPRDSAAIMNGSSLTCTLPDPTSTGISGRKYEIKNIHATAASVASAGTSKTIDGAASVSLAQWEAITVMTDGAAWFIINKVAAPSPAIALSLVFGG